MPWLVSVAGVPCVTILVLVAAMNVFSQIGCCFRFLNVDDVAVATN